MKAKMKVTYKNGDIVVSDEIDELNYAIEKGYIKSVEVLQHIVPKEEVVEALNIIEKSAFVFEVIYYGKNEINFLCNGGVKSKGYVPLDKKYINTIKRALTIPKISEEVIKIGDIAFQSMTDKEKVNALNEIRNVIGVDRYNKIKSLGGTK